MTWDRVVSFACVAIVLVRVNSLKSTSLEPRILVVEQRERVVLPTSDPASAIDGLLAAECRGGDGGDYRSVCGPGGAGGGRMRYFDRQLGVLVPNTGPGRPEQQSRRILGDVIRKRPDEPFAVRMLLMKYSDADVTPLIADTQQNPTSSAAQDFFLEAIHPTMTQHENLFSYIGPVQSLKQAQSSAYYGIAYMTRFLEPGSIILIFVNGVDNETGIGQLAMKGMLDKNIKLLAVWIGPKKPPKMLLLMEMVNATNGAFLAENSDFSNDSYHTSESAAVELDLKRKQSIILQRFNISGIHDLKFPVDSSSTGMHIRLQPANVDAIELFSPEGKLIKIKDLFKTAVNETAQNDQVTNMHLAQLDAQITFEGLYGSLYSEINPVRVVSIDVGNPVGIWRLHLGSQTVAVNVSVAVLSDYIVRPPFFVYGENDLVQFDIDAKLRQIDQVIFLNQDGTALKDPIAFKIRSSAAHPKPHASWPYTAGMEEIKEPGHTIEISYDRLPNKPMYIVVNGTDSQGQKFMRSTYFNRNNIRNILPPTVVELGIKSQLSVSSGAIGTILFEVTNNRGQQVLMNFGVRDDQWMLQRMNPTRSYVSPGQTVVVSVTYRMRSTVVTDTVVFSAFAGGDRYEKTALVRGLEASGTIGGNAAYDRDPPLLWAEFKSDCVGVLSCGDRTWSAEAHARDPHSGLMVLQSSPKGLYFATPYISGTKDEVVGTYSASCCENRIQLFAVDSVGNERYIEINAYVAPLSATMISLIVLAVVILLIAIGIAIFCYRRRKQEFSLNLPTYRGPTASRDLHRY